MALSAALFVGCKKEKEQYGPSLTPSGESGVVTGDLTLAPNTDTTLRFKLIAQKGSGKDDADLKDYSFTVEIGGVNYPVYTNRPAPNGQSFTIDTLVRVRGLSGEVRRYTFTITDKNGKSTSRAFKITFQDTTGSGGGGGDEQPPRYVDSLLNASYTNQSDNKGTHLRYQVGSGTLTLQTRAQANNNPSEILFVYWFGGVRHSVISPAILRNDIYNNTDPEWDNAFTQATYFREAPSSVNFATAGYGDIISAFNNGTDVNDFTNNGNERARCTTGRVLAFKQGNIYGLIRVDQATDGTPGARLSVKVARP
jgi:hypothetical protein